MLTLCFVFQNLLVNSTHDETRMYNITKNIPTNKGGSYYRPKFIYHKVPGFLTTSILSNHAKDKHMSFLYQGEKISYRDLKNLSSLLPKVTGHGIRRTYFKNNGVKNIMSSASMSGAVSGDAYETADTSFRYAFI